MKSTDMILEEHLTSGSIKVKMEGKYRPLSFSISCNNWQNCDFCWITVLFTAFYPGGCVKVSQIWDDSFTRQLLLPIHMDLSCVETIPVMPDANAI